MALGFAQENKKPAALYSSDLEDQVIEKMEENGIGCAVNYRALHTLTYFKEKFGYKPEDFPIANEMGNRTITLPLYPKLSEKEVRIVCNTLEKVISVI